MLIITSLEQLHCQFENVAMALGTFDGVHLAHQFVIGRAVHWSRQYEGTSMVFTFANHPLSVIDPNRVPLQLQTLADKTVQIKRLGVTVLVRIPFTKELLHLQPEDFVHLLATKVKPRHIVVGPNYSFGDKAAGNPVMLTGLCDRYGIETEICPEIKEQGVMVSSTAIRELLTAGEVTAAARLLGRPFELCGRVVYGDQRGRALGFPTANIQSAPRILVPGNGVYAVKVKIGARYYNGLCNIGTNPTFVKGPLRVETHILDFDREIYGKTIKTLFIARLRSEKKFASAAELVAQMKRDLQQAQDQFFS